MNDRIVGGVGHIFTLLTKAAESADSADAQRFTQAAQNAANALGVLSSIRPRPSAPPPKPKNPDDWPAVDTVLNAQAAWIGRAMLIDDATYYFIRSEGGKFFVHRDTPDGPVVTFYVADLREWYNLKLPLPTAVASPQPATMSLYTWLKSYRAGIAAAANKAGVVFATVDEYRAPGASQPGIRIRFEITGNGVEPFVRENAPFLNSHPYLLVEFTDYPFMFPPVEGKRYDLYDELIPLRKATNG